MFGDESTNVTVKSTTLGLNKTTFFVKKEENFQQKSF